MNKPVIKVARVDINKHTAPHIVALHTEPAGPNAIVVTMPDGNDIVIERRPAEPWQETLRNLAEMLHLAYDLFLAGNPYLRKKRPQLLLAIPASAVMKPDLVDYLIPTW